MTLTHWHYHRNLEFYPKFHTNHHATDEANRAPAHRERQELLDTTGLAEIAPLLRSIEADIMS